jgi:hypothetical protein
MHTEDVLSHIAGPETFAARASAINGCVTVITIGVASVEVCWQLSGDEVIITSELKTPLGNVELGRCVISPSDPHCTVGASIDGFKAEVTLTANFSNLTLTIEGTACAPIVGCATGSVTIHF